MRNDIVKLIEAEKDVTNVIVLTHNIDFVFIQSVVIPALRRCGHPSLTVFADAQCANESYQHQHLVLNSLGRRFRVVPVAMQPGYRFHPKAILLSGQKKATLLIGSGNLTFGGWRENAEIWCRFDTDVDGTAPFSAFKGYLDSVLTLTPLQDTLRAEVDECFEGQSRSWAVDMLPPDRLVGRPFANEALINQMRAVTPQNVTSTLICSPYFDDSGNALQNIATSFGVRPKVAVQRCRSGLKAEAAVQLGTTIELSTVNFHHLDHESNSREAFIHAKWYGFVHEDTVTVFLGSANCSNAALIVPGSAGNAELMTYATVSKEEFASLLTDELEFIDAEPQLQPITSVDEPDKVTVPAIRIMAARLDQDVIQIAFNHGEGVTVTHLCIDGTGADFLIAEPGVMVSFGVPAESRQVSLKGTSSDRDICSNLMWIDREQDLSTTARSRSVIDAVRKGVNSQGWSIGTWSDISNVFLRNLQYMPSRAAFSPRLVARGERTSEINQVYSAEDVFSDSYGLPRFTGHFTQLTDGFDDRVTSLRQLLLRWFGLKETREGDDSPVDHSGQPHGMNPSDEIVPMPNPGPRPVRTVAEIKESDRRRALQMLQLITESITSEGYLTQRLPETLSVDIQFTSVLLRAGLHEEWISPVEFFASTQKIWSTLFFSCPADPAIGWLEYRYRNEEDPALFIERLVSPKLTAALAAWAFAIPNSGGTPEQVRFRLSQVLSVSRLPWLWEHGAREEVANELREVLSITGNGLAADFWQKIEVRWNDLIRQGYALKLAQDALANKTPLEIKSLIRQQDVKKGELLWQGKAGFCVARQDFSRTIGSRAPILYLQNSAEGIVVADFTIPVKGVIESEVVTLNEKQRTVLIEMFTSLLTY